MFSESRDESGLEKVSDSESRPWGPFQIETDPTGTLLETPGFSVTLDGVVHQNQFQ